MYLMRIVGEDDTAMKKAGIITAVVSALALACIGCIDLFQPEGAAVKPAAG